MSGERGTTDHPASTPSLKGPTMTAPEQHPAADLIAAVLAVTPKTIDGLVVDTYDIPHRGPDGRMFYTNESGPAEPIAARQAVAVLRWAVYNCEELWPQADPLAWISRLADAIEAAR